MGTATVIDVLFYKISFVLFLQEESMFLLLLFHFPCTIDCACKDCACKECAWQNSS